MTTATMVPVTDLLRNLAASCDAGNLRNESDWISMMRWKATDESFWDLLEAIPIEGFRVPIFVVVRPDGTWEMGNGHHRLTAAILLVLHEVPVIFGEPTDDYCPEPSCGDGDVVNYFGPVVDDWRKAEETMLNAAQRLFV